MLWSLYLISIPRVLFRLWCRISCLVHKWMRQPSTSNYLDHFWTIHLGFGCKDASLMKLIPDFKNWLMIGIMRQNKLNHSIVVQHLILIVWFRSNKTYNNVSIIRWKGGRGGNIKPRKIGTVSLKRSHNVGLPCWILIADKLGEGLCQNCLVFFQDQQIVNY